MRAHVTRYAVGQNFHHFTIFPRRTFCRARCSRDQSEETLSLVSCALDGERENFRFFAAILLDFIAVLWICNLLHIYIIAINLVHTAHPSITFTAVFLIYAQFRLMFGRAIDCDWNSLLQLKLTIRVWLNRNLIMPIWIGWNDGRLAARSFVDVLTTFPRSTRFVQNFQLLFT